MSFVSPSVEYSFEGGAEAVSTNSNIKIDYVEGRMTAWGALIIAPPKTVRLDDPYISPALHPFATPVPIFVQAGGAEVLCDSVQGFAKVMSALCCSRQLGRILEVPDVPHDVYAVGTILGWPKGEEDIHTVRRDLLCNNPPIYSSSFRETRLPG